MGIVEFLKDEAATLQCAAKLARSCDDTAILFLHGSLGAGKTTFSRGFLHALGFQGNVKSPTYTLVEPYQFEHFFLYHFDFYRVTDPYELELMGIADYFIPHAICLIEWPENGAELLPVSDVSCYIELRELGREIKFVANTLRGETILQRYQHEK